MFLGRRQIDELWRRRLAWLLLIAFALSQFPLPASSRLSYLSGIPFPCEGGSCGCGSAIQCWTNCCCMTSRQRLAWAKEHGVTPPSFATASVSSESQITDLAHVNSLDAPRQAVGTNKSAEKKSCCSTKRVAAKRVSNCCIDGANDLAEDSVALVSSGKGKTASSCCTDGPKDQAKTLVLQALKCRGAATGFVNLPWYKLYQNPESLLAWCSPDLFKPWFDIHAASFVSEIITPPPRSCFIFIEA